MKKDEEKPAEMKHERLKKKGSVKYISKIKNFRIYACIIIIIIILYTCYRYLLFKNC